MDAAVMFVVPQLSTDRMTPVSMAPVDFLRQNLGLQRFYSLGPIAANYGSDFGIASLNVNDLPVPKTYSQFVLSSLDANTDPLLFTGTFRVNPAGPSALDEFIRNADNYAAAGMKYLVTATDPAVAERVVAAGLEPVYDDGTVSIFEAPAPTPYFQPGDPTCWATVVDWQSADVQCDQSTTLIRLELSDPGWSATVDGHDVAITTTATIFQSVDVPSGTSRVVFRYAPRRIGFAWLGALLAAVWIAVVTVRGRRPGRLDRVRVERVRADRLGTGQAN